MRLRTLFLVAISLAVLVGGLWYWRKTEAAAARRLEAWDLQQRLDATEAALERQLDWPRQTVSLVDFPAVIAESSGLAVDIDRIAIEAEGNELPNIRVDIPGGTFSIGSVLRLGLSPHELCYDLGDRRLTITTPTISRDRSRLRTVVYPLPQPEGANWESDSWAALIGSTIEPSSWDDAGGPGHIEDVPGALVVVQTRDVHRQVRVLIEALGRFDDWPTSLAPLPLPPCTTGPIEQRIRAALDELSSLQCEQLPLNVVIAQLAQRHAIPIHLESQRLVEAGISPDVPISKRLENISLRSILQLTLGELELAYVIRNETLVITTSENAEGWLVSIAYPVHDLCATPRATNLNELIDVITSCVFPRIAGPM